MCKIVQLHVDGIEFNMCVYVYLCNMYVYYARPGCVFKIHVNPMSHRSTSDKSTKANCRELTAMLLQHYDDEAVTPL